MVNNFWWCRLYARVHISPVNRVTSRPRALSLKSSNSNQVIEGLSGLTLWSRACCISAGSRTTMWYGISVGKGTRTNAVCALASGPSVTTARVRATAPKMERANVVKAKPQRGKEGTSLSKCQSEILTGIRRDQAFFESAEYVLNKKL